MSTNLEPTGGSEAVPGAGAEGPAREVGELWSDIDPSLASVFEPGVPALRDEIVAMVTSMPDYSRPLTGEFGRVLETGVEVALRRFLDGIARGDDDALGPSRSVYLDLGRYEFEAGRPLDALLRTYRLGARIAWRRIAARGQEAGLDPEAIYRLAESVFAYIDELSAVSIEGYSRAREVAAGTQQVARGTLISMLVDDPQPESGRVVAEAAKASWELPRSLAVIVAERGPEAARIAARLGPGVIGAQHGGRACLVAADPDRPGFLAEARAALDGIGAAIGPSVGWRDAPRSHRRAVQALEIAESDGERADRGLVEADRMLVSILLGADPEIGRELAASRLAPIERMSPRSRRAMPETLLAWLANGGDVNRVAEGLHVHPQTVRYRLRKLREAFGDQLDEPEARFELEVALRFALDHGQVTEDGAEADSA